MINYVPNDCLQMPVPQDEEDDRIILNIPGALVDILCEINPEIYKPYVRFDKKSRENILYVHMLKVL